MQGMKRRFGYGLGSSGLLAAALWMACTPAFTQNQNSSSQGVKPAAPIVGDFSKVTALPPGGPAPRTADGHPDLSGRYYPNAAGRMLEAAYPVGQDVMRQFDPKVTPEEKPVFKPGMYDKYKSPVPYGTCDQAGTPTSITIQANQHGPIVFIQTPGVLVFLAEYPLTVRMIPTDGRPHTKDPDPTFSGDSVGHWEKDTLVVEAIDIDTRLRNIAVGFGGEGGAWLHSDKERVIERFTRTSKNYLIYQVTIDDPVLLEKPWTSAPHKWTLSQDPTDTWQEYFCTLNEEPEEYKKIGEPPVGPVDFSGEGQGGRGGR